MEWFDLAICVYLNLVEWRQYFVVDRSPAVVLDSFVPTFVLVVFWLVKFDVKGLLSFCLFNLIIIPWSEGVDIADCSVHEDFVVN